MAQPFVGEIRMVAFTFPPQGWAFCNGQLLPINQNAALFGLLGTTYGGDGTTTFGLPNLQGKTAVHVGNNIALGNAGGEESHLLIASEMPAHSHTLNAYAGGASANDPQNSLLATAANVANPYGDPGGALVAMSAQAITAAGGSQPHPNIQPSLAVNFVIALQGIFPPHN